MKAEDALEPGLPSGDPAAALTRLASALRARPVEDLADLPQEPVRGEGLWQEVASASRSVVCERS
jgi:hypothetical protein